MIRLKGWFDYYLVIESDVFKDQIPEFVLQMIGDGPPASGVGKQLKRKTSPPCEIFLGFRKRQTGVVERSGPLRHDFFRQDGIRECLDGRPWLP